MLEATRARAAGWRPAAAARRRALRARPRLRASPAAARSRRTSRRRRRGRAHARELRTSKETDRRMLDEATAHHRPRQDRGQRPHASSTALPGVEIVGVTKVTCGTPEVARAMLAGGVAALGESRLENIARLRAGGHRRPRSGCCARPRPAWPRRPCALADVSLVSELDVVAALDARGRARGRRVTASSRWSTSATCARA